MGGKNRPNPDHYQARPERVGEDALYREETRKLRGQEAPPPRVRDRGGPHKGQVVHAGQPVLEPLLTVCLACDAEVGFDGDSVVTACPNCGSDTFRVVA